MGGVRAKKSEEQKKRHGVGGLGALVARDSWVTFIFMEGKRNRAFVCGLYDSLFFL